MLIVREVVTVRICQQGFAPFLIANVLAGSWLSNKAS